MAVTTHGYLPRTFQKGLEEFVKKPENIEWAAKLEESIRETMEIINSLDPETKAIWLNELSNQ